MDDKPKRPRPTEQPAPEGDDGAVRAAPTPGGDLASEAAVAAPAEMVSKDTYLRLAAEYDNFRKRTLKERTELWSKAQADLVQRLVDALDDLARFAHIEPSAETAKTIHEGVDLVERKIWKELEAAGVRRVDQIGVPFDPSQHEAVTTAPASRSEEHTSELQSQSNLVCRLLLEKKKNERSVASLYRPSWTVVYSPRCPTSQDCELA